MSAGGGKRQFDLERLKLNGFGHGSMQIVHRHLFHVVEQTWHSI